MAFEWIIGIVVTAVVGIITIYYTVVYRSTKVDTEKARNARKEIESTLLRSIIQQGLDPSLTEIQRMINSKAREYSISPEQIAHSKEIVEDIYTKTVESDFIVPRLKKRIIPVLNKILSEEKPKTQKIELAYLEVKRRRKILRLITVAMTFYTIAYLLYLLIESIP